MSDLGKIVHGLLLNFPLVAALVAMAVAQTIKVFYYLWKEGEWQIAHFFETGGLPSGHSAMVTALTVGLAYSQGLHSPLFAISLIFSIVVMYDAAGVRRATGKQALILNRVVEDIYATGKVSDGKLQELVGHTPFEVVVGVSVGLLTTLALSPLWCR